MQFDKKQLGVHLEPIVCSELLKVNSSATGSPSWAENASRFSNDGALIPRSIRLRKSTDMPRSSANCSWLMFLAKRIPFRRWPNLSRKLGT